MSLTLSKHLKIIWLILGVWALLMAFFLPITQDEAYYTVWGRYLALGYFDHPPLVAFFSYLSSAFGYSALSSRLTVILSSLISAGVLAQLYGHSLSRFPKVVIYSLILACFNLAFLSNSVLLTPDSPLSLFWILSLHESYFALTQNRKRWLSAGLFCGLGIISKYTMLIMGLIFLLQLWRLDRKALKSPWPYLGGCVALLVIVPHLLWNSDNHWAPFRFQLQHGLSLDAQTPWLASDLPRPQYGEFQKPLSFIPEILNLGQDTDKVVPNHPQNVTLLSQFVAWFHKLSYTWDYLGGVLLLWGMHVFLLLGVVVQRRKRGVPSAESVTPREVERSLEFFKIACFVPLLLFLLLSLKGKIEANWAALYLMGAAPLLAYQAVRLGRHVMLGLCFSGFLNALLLGLVCLHTQKPFLPISKDRILRETHGYQELSEKVRSLGEPILADSYQITAMLRYYLPELSIAQWPHITRPSEFVRNPKFTEGFSWEDLKQKKTFWLVTTHENPILFPSFKESQRKSLLDCRDLFYVQSENLVPCEAIHHWHLVQYTYTERF